METPLISGNNGGDDGGGDYAPARSVKQMAVVFAAETVKLWKIAAPLVVSILCTQASGVVKTSFVGHLGELQLSAVSFSISVISGFAFGVLQGMGSALETLCGQAYGAGQIHMLGIYLQRSWITLLLCGLALAPLYIFATPILILLGQDHDIANLSGQFSIYTLPQLFAFAINLPTQKFLQGQSKVNVLAWVGFVYVIVEVVLLWLVISVLGLGLGGVAIALDITSWVVVLVELVYVFGWCKDAWSEFSWAVFTEVWGFAKLSVVSSVMICLETWYMMSINLLTGHLKDAVIAVGSLSICFNITGIQSTFYDGIRYAISVRVSNELGLLHPRAAKYSVYATVLQSLLIGLLCMLLILVAGDYIVAIYTDSKDLQLAVSNLTWLLLLSLLVNSVQPVISGVAVGGGWQAIVAYINLGCFYIFGLPLAYILGYIANFGTKGIWGGMIAGNALQALILLLIVYKTNWNTEVEETSSRMKKWGGKYIKEEKIDGHIS